MLRVPDGEGEHATQSLHRGRACLLVQVHDGFGVGGRPEPVPAPRQVRAQLAIVVDLAVEDDDLGAVLVRDRLAPSFQVDDAQPAHAEADLPRDEKSFVVGPTVANGPAHRPDHSRLDGLLQIAVNDAYDAAHTSAGSSVTRGGAPVIPSSAVNNRSACARRP